MSIQTSTMSEHGEKNVDAVQRVEHTAPAALTLVRSNDSHINDNDKSAVAAEAQQIAAQWVDGTEEEKRLKRKLDWRILPCTWVLYLLGYLDRANIGYVRYLIDSYCYALAR